MECSFTALDAWFSVEAAPVRFEIFDGDLVSLAKEKENLQYSALPYADATIEEQNKFTKQTTSFSSESIKSIKSILFPIRTCIICRDDISDKTAFPHTRLIKNKEKNSFDARNGVYKFLRDKVIFPEHNSPELILFEASILASRYDYEPETSLLSSIPKDLSVEVQRDILELVVTGKNPAKGFKILLDCGFVENYWPELYSLLNITQSKDFHPEGDVWQHTMETFSYRKTLDPLLSIALLLHDCGKAEAVSFGGKRFDQHAEIGEKIASRFLSRLGYNQTIINAVSFLVRYHMLPAALPRMPLNALGNIMADPLMPLLLELYRCDESSTFRGPEGYYDACATYKNYLKQSKNPYRNKR